jgi:integrase
VASIERRQTNTGETWRVIYRIGSRQVVDTFTNAEAAVEFKALVERIGGAPARGVLEARRNKGSGDFTVSDLFSKYLAQITGITDGTRSEYRRVALRSWLPILGELPVVVLKGEHVAAWINGAKGLSGKTLRNQISLLSAAMIYAAKPEGLNLPIVNPCQGIKISPTVQAEAVWLSEQEFATLYAVIPARWQPLVAMLAGTSIRWGEATALRWNDLDLDAAVPVVRITRAQKHGVEGNERVEGVTKTNRSRRTVSLPSQLAEQLRSSKVSGNGYIFAEDDGSAINHQHFYKKIWLPAVEKADLGKRPTIHSLRHSSASWLIDKGLPLPIIQRRLGHESITTTVNVYGHLMPGALSEAASAASDALSRAIPITALLEIES